MQQGASINDAVKGAAQGGHVDLVIELLQQGANINDAVRGAAKGGHRNLAIKLLQKESADINIAIEYATKAWHGDLAEELLRQGAQLEVTLKRNFQDIIINLSNKLNIPGHDQGICQGLAVMGILAGLAGDMEKFTNRLEIMIELNSNYDQWQSELEISISSQRTGQIITASLRDIETFLGLLNIFHFPRKYKDIFYISKGTPESQESILDKLPLFAPVALDSKQIFQESGSYLQTLDDWERSCPRYTLEDIDVYFKNIASLTIESPVTLLLKNYHHAISIVYNPQNPGEKWTLIDARKGILTCNITALGKHVFGSFLCKNKSHVDFVADIFHTGNLGEQLIHCAAAKGDVEEIGRLIQQGANIDIPKKNGDTPLHMAALEGQVEAIKILLKNGADFNKQNRQQKTPLQIAILKGHSEAVKELLKMPISLEQIARFGNNAFPVFAEINFIDGVRFLCRNKFLNINQPSKDGFTALHFSAKNGNLEMAKLLALVKFKWVSMRSLPC